MWPTRRTRWRATSPSGSRRTSGATPTARNCSLRSTPIRAIEPGARGVDQLDGAVAALEALNVDVLALGLLVHREEVLDLRARERRDVVEVLEVVPVGVLVGHADDLVVAARVVADAQDGDRADVDHTAWEGGLADQHNG